MGHPTLIGRYEIVKTLGSGAMGDVYRAVDTQLSGREVALKILSEELSGNEEARARFNREVEISSRLAHPNIVTIHDRGEHEGRPYFVMEFVRGVHLSRFIKEIPPDTIARRVEIAKQIAGAVAFAHDHKVIHRDIKPANIMISTRGSLDHVKLLDFGIVHVERSTLTLQMAQPGTFTYMAPEQIRSDTIDHRCDLFSLGIVLYELFTGAHPFEAPSDFLVSGKILAEEPERPSEKNASVPPVLDAIVLKLLAKEPERRPPTAGDVSAALDGVLRTIGPPEPVSDAIPSPPPAEEKEEEPADLVEAIRERLDQTDPLVSGNRKTLERAEAICREVEELLERLRQEDPEHEEVAVLARRLEILQGIVTLRLGGMRRGKKG